MMLVVALPSVLADPARRNGARSMRAVEGSIDHCLSDCEWTERREKNRC